jgi:hypothetical protein
MVSGHLLKTVRQVHLGDNRDLYLLSVLLNIQIILHLKKTLFLNNSCKGFKPIDSM